MRLAYADPPYPGNAELYREHRDYAGEVDHAELVDRLSSYDGWILHTSSKAVGYVLGLCPEDVRVLAWVNHNIGRAWEPIIVRAARPHGPPGGGHRRDWIAVEVEAFQWRPRPDDYVIGRKPRKVCEFCFDWLGALPGEDSLDDLFPGSGAVTAAWQSWSRQPRLTDPHLITRRDVRNARKPTETWLTIDGIDGEM